MQSKYKLVYVIILNWNGKNDTIECVKSCANLQYCNYAILVVDNNSTDGSYDALKRNFPYIEIIQNADNLGFAGGNNVGIRHALEKGADYIWLLNNDTIVAQDALTELVDLMGKKTNIGIVGSKIYYYDAPEHLWFAGGWIDYETGCSGHRGEGEKDTGKYDEVMDVDYISGCSLMISRNAIELVGLMDERYFLLFEETDWNERVRKAGFNIMYAPKSKVWHKISKSIGAQSPIYSYYLFRNSLLFTVKHNKKYIYRVLWHKCKEIRAFFKSHQRDKARSAFKGLLDFFLFKFGKSGCV